MMCCQNLEGNDTLRQDDASLGCHKQPQDGSQAAIS